ncbi:MAG TPA: RNA polymerase sigma factor [Bacteroidia bacterium]|nr:RNA polymerase sigma factor [Bacteroidia bacterium]
MNNNWYSDGQNRNVPIVTDEQILTACARGDRRAQSRLYQQCYSFMMSICIRYTHSRDDAEDLLNRSFLKVLNNLGSKKDNVPFALWVRRITINTVIDEFRKNKKKVQFTEINDHDGETEEPDANVVNEYLEQVKVEHLQSLINKLPEASRKVFNLYAVDGFGHKEIAAMLNISEGTSKWHLNAARTRLKELVFKDLPQIKSLAS